MTERLLEMLAHLKKYDLIKTWKLIIYYGSGGTEGVFVGSEMVETVLEVQGEVGQQEETASGAEERQDRHDSAGKKNIGSG